MTDMQHHQYTHQEETENKQPEDHLEVSVGQYLQRFQYDHCIMIHVCLYHSTMLHSHSRTLLYPRTAEAKC